MAGHAVNYEQTLADQMVKCYADPLRFVMLAFPWDSDPSLQIVKLPEPWASRFNCEYGPDAWACQILDDIGADVRSRKFDGVHAVPPIQYAVSSGHGIGKSVSMQYLRYSTQLALGTV